MSSDLDVRPAFHTADELKGRLVLVAANLAPKKLAGFPSNGMVLCASDAAHEKVVCVDPPAGAAVGERVALAGLPNAPAEPKQCDKKKLFAKAQPHFVTKGGVCYYKDKPFTLASGDVTCAVPDGYTIS